MSNTSLDLEDDINKIINEVEDLGGNDDDLDIDDILNEDENSQLKSSGKKQNQIKNGYFPHWIKKLGKNFTEKYEHPLKLIESYERNIAAELGGQADLDSKFLLCNYRSSFESKFSNVLFKDLEIDQLTNNIHFAGQDNSPRKPKEFWGTPKCIAILPPKYIAIGTSNSVIMVFDYNQTSYQKIGTKKEQEYGEVTAIDLSVKDDSLASGYQTGHIILWGILKSEQIMVVQPTESGPILSLKFWKDTKHNMIASNSEGFVYLYRLESVFFQWIMDRKVILTPNNEKKSATQESAQSLKSLPDGFITIQLLKCEQKMADETTPGYFVALGSAKMVLIVSLEPTIAKVFKYMRPLDVGYSNIPSVSWGMGIVGSDMSQKKDTLLSIAWGNYVDVFLFKENELDYAKMVKYLASYRSATEISHHEWISENNLLLYDPRGKFRLVSTSILKPRPSQEQPEEQDNSKLATLIAKQDPDVAFDIYNHIKEDEDFSGGHYQRPILYYSNTVLGFSLMRRVFILGFKKAYYVKHLEWKEYLEVLKSKADWLSAMTFFVILYQGSEKSFAGLSSNLEQNRKLLKPYSVTLSQDFINSIKEINGTPEQGNEIWKTSMLTVMDFLVAVDNYEYLFTDVRKLFKSWHMQEDFFLAMEAFILRNRIKRIPNECLRELTEQYIPQGKIDVVEYLIMNLWIKYVDIDSTLSLCMEFNLLTALMYLCSHRIDSEGPDFLTPIARALSTYQKGVEEQDSKSQDYGLKFLWFLDMILQGKMFPHGRVPDYLWRERIKDIMMLVFEQANLGLMLQIDPHIAFEILQKFFESDFTTFLETFREDAIKLIGDINEDATTKAKSKELGLHFKKILQMFTEVSDNKLKTQMIALIYYCSKRNKESHNMLYYTLAKLVDENKIDLPESVVEECLIYLLKNARVYPVWENLSDQKQLINNDDEDDDPEDLVKDERIRIILVLLRKLEGKISPEKLKEIADLADSTDFVDVRVYLLQLAHQYKRCFDLYLNQPSKKKRVKIFYWLEATIPKLRDGRHADYFKDVIDSILYRLRELVSISSEKTRRIILNLDQKLEDEVIRQLQPFPNLQLEYLNGLFAQRETTEISDALLILYIKLLCQLDPKQVIKELTTYTYPLDACIKLCKEYDVKDAYALLLERAGNPSEALKITLELFRSSLEQKFKKIEKEKIFNKSGSLLRKLNSAKDICRKYNRPGDAESESLWFYVLDSILACYSDYVANNKAVQDALKQEEDDSAQAKAYRKLGRAYLDYIANLFEDMSKCVAIENILTKFEDFGSLKLGDLKTPILGMLKAYYYESNILKDTRALTMGDMFDNLGYVYYSVTVGSWCYKPNLGMYLGEDVVLFNCGHLFVRDMLKGNLCTICCDREALKVQNALNNVKKGVHMRGRAPTNAVVKFFPLKFETNESGKESQEKNISPTLSPELKKKAKQNLQKKENLKKLSQFDKVNSDKDDWFSAEDRQINFHDL